MACVYVCVGVKSDDVRISDFAAWVYGNICSYTNSKSHIHTRGNKIKD